MTLKKDLSIDFLGIKCENPFFLSSSPVGSNYEMCKKALEAGWGGIFYKTIGIFIPDECSPRFDVVKKEDQPWVGFKNMEMISDKPLEVNLEYMRKLKEDYPNKVIVASIMGSSVEEWKQLTRMVTEVGVDAIECNFSCPQMTSSSMGSDVGTNPDLVREYTRACVEETHLPIIAKMTPNITSMEVSAKAAIEGGAKGLAAINTVKSLTNIDFENFTAMPVVNGKSSVSGYSGAAVKPIALRFCYNLKSFNETKDIPLSGIGGIETWKDCLEFLLLGCENLQVTTAVMQYGYRIVEDMISGISYWMEQNNVDRLSDIIGKALPNIVGADEIDRSFKIIPKIDLDKCTGCGRCYVSCFDGAHQAIDWDQEKRQPCINDNCVGCHLCLNVCPVLDCILPGEIKIKEGREDHEIAIKHNYD